MFLKAQNFKKKDQEQKEENNLQGIQEIKVNEDWREAATGGVL